MSTCSYLTVPTLQHRRPIELLKTCIILFIIDNPNYNLIFPLRLNIFTRKIKEFISNIDNYYSNLSDLLTIPYIINNKDINFENNLKESISLNKLIESSSFNQFLFCIKQILIEIEYIHLSQIIDKDDKDDKTVIISCNKSLLKIHFESLLSRINNYKLKSNKKILKKIPKKRTWHEVYDEDLLFSSNFVYPLSKRQRIDINDDEHNKKILQRLPVRLENNNNNNKTIKEIGEEISDLLDYKSYDNMLYIDKSKEIINILRTPSTKDILINNLYSTKGTKAVNEFCEYGTKYECKNIGCNKIHFIRIMRPHTMPTLGDCSYLDGCRHMDTCRFIHYVIDEECVSNKKPYFRARKFVNKLILKQDIDIDNDDSDCSSSVNTEILESQIYQNEAIHRYEAQWVNCDVRALDFNVLGKFGVIMADPPWDIHMELPYGTLTDEEMLDLGVGILADDNCLLFLWVTGRVMETARKCMKRWGFICQEEILWIKTNQLQRIIRTGRTGHWLNHSKEHCLVGVKGNDIRWNRCLDCDVLVAEVRETSRKPDEIYNLIERLSPGTKKIEIFGRPHNTRPGWMTLGNQLNGTRILNQKIYKKFHNLYPTINVIKNIIDETEDDDDIETSIKNSSSSSEQAIDNKSISSIQSSSSISQHGDDNKSISSLSTSSSISSSISSSSSGSTSTCSSSSGSSSSGSSSSSSTDFESNTKC